MEDAPASLFNQFGLLTITAKINHKLMFKFEYSVSLGTLQLV